MTHTINRTVYSQLVAQFAPKVIETESEYEEVLAEVEKLLFNKNRTVEEDTLYDLLVMLVERYEAENHAIESPNVSSLIEHLLDTQEKREADLVKVFGISERVAEVLGGNALPTQAEANALGEYFRVSSDLFI